ncbi:MAG: prepilin-type N-terminal cleavage/methylation domain-containing protein [Phycisphaerales bacterium]|jgi:prepilin-type N-terminal cleavage/methylation domain-containing protein|nr:prepilin-type N-terminal cleavage/methylation domain-containing protein [Phycisphaerales bacterium]
MRMPMRVMRDSLARGFTIAEVIVVVIIIGLLATLVVPRLAGVAGRQSEVEAAAVASLVSAMASRDAASSTPLALAFDASTKRLSVLELRSDATENADGAAGEVRWLPARLLRPVTLNLTEIREVTSGGTKRGGSESEANWRIDDPSSAGVSSGGAGGITLVVRTVPGGVGEARAWQVDLVPGAVAAQMRSIGWDEAARPAMSRAVDLDATGRRAESW